MLFQYVNGDGEPQPITSADVNDYIRDATGGDFTAKHFRTWGASVIFFEQLLAQGRGRADQPQDRARAGRRSARQHRRDEPQILCPPGADRRAQGRSARPAARHGAAARAHAACRAPKPASSTSSKTQAARARAARPRLEPQPLAPPQARPMNKLESRSAAPDRKRLRLADRQSRPADRSARWSPPASSR